MLMRSGQKACYRLQLILGIISVYSAWISWSFAANDSARPLTKIESRQLAPEIVKHRVLDQLSDILVLQAYPKSNQRPRLPLGDLYFWTKPHASVFPGLCATDELIIQVEPVGTKLNGADTQTKAVGLRTTPYYYFLTPPVAALPDDFGLSLPELKKADKACAKLKPQESIFFKALDEEHATEGIWLIDTILKQARKNDFAFALSCKNLESYTAEQCLNFLTKAQIADVARIDDCEIPESDSVATTCRTITFWSPVEVRIYTSGRSPEIKILRVDVYQIVTVGDAKAD